MWPRVVDGVCSEDETLIGTDFVSVVSRVLKIGEDLKMVQCDASDHMTPGGSLEEKVEPRLGHSWRLPQEETSEEEHDDGVSGSRFLGQFAIASHSRRKDLG